MISSIFITFLLISATTSETCNNVENTETNAYTYHICSETSIRDFDMAQDFCSNRLDTKRDDGVKANLVTFPNKDEFDFLIDHLNATMDKDTLFYPGIYQKQNKENKYNPETGRFYWVTDEASQIDADSNSYWEPFADWITNFDGLDLKKSQTGNFLMDKYGNTYPFVRLGATLASEINNPVIICMSEGVMQFNVGSTEESVHYDNDTTLETWMIIVIAAGGIFVLIIVGILIGCCISKKREKYHNVPTDEKKVPQQAPPPPPEYQA